MDRREYLKQWFAKHPDYNKLWRQKNQEHRRQYQHDYHKRTYVKSIRVKQTQAQKNAYKLAWYHAHKNPEKKRAYYRANRGKWLEWQRECRRKYPERSRTRATLGRAVKNGTLIRGACEMCGAVKTEAHHENYSKPLEVRWLCRLHHAELSRRWNKWTKKINLLKKTNLREPKLN